MSNIPIRKGTAGKAPAIALDPCQRYTIEETAQYLRSSRVSVYKLIAAKRLTPIYEGSRRTRKLKDGREIEVAGRTFVPGSEIARLSQVPAEGGA